MLEFEIDERLKTAEKSKGVRIAERARDYVRQLADGVNPFTGEELPDDTVLNDVKLSRCFFYVAGVLEQEVGRIESAERRAERQVKGGAGFSMTQAQKDAVVLSDDPVPVTVLADMFNAQASDNVKKLSAVNITSWLFAYGYLTQSADNEHGTHSRIPTLIGGQIGITSEEREGQRGTYFQNFYSKSAQKLILNDFVPIADDAV
jgi:hypothetical protein